MAFDATTIELVWRKGAEGPRYNAAVYRQDRYGRWMARASYGDRDDQFGWEIDHIVPVAKGGTDALGNLQPLNWVSNASKRDH